MLMWVEMLKKVPPYGEIGTVTQVADHIGKRLVRNGKAKEAANPNETPRKAKRAKPENKALSAEG